MQTINIKLKEQQHQSVINLLNQGLVDTYLLLIKTKKYHWAMEGFLSISSLNGHSRNVPMATEMVSQVLKGHEQIIQNLREQAEQCTSEFEDDGTVDFLTRLMEKHEKTASMLRSFLQGELS